MLPANRRAVRSIYEYSVISSIIKAALVPLLSPTSSRAHMITVSYFVSNVMGPLASSIVKIDCGDVSVLALQKEVVRLVVGPKKRRYLTTIPRSALVIDDIIKGRWVKADPKLRSLCVCSVLIHTNGDLSGIHPSTACSSPIRHLTAERKKFLQSPSSSSSVHECRTSYATSANGFIHE